MIDGALDCPLCMGTIRNHDSGCPLQGGRRTRSGAYRTLQAHIQKQRESSVEQTKYFKQLKEKEERVYGFKAKPGSYDYKADWDREWEEFEQYGSPAHSLTFAAVKHNHHVERRGCLMEHHCMQETPGVEPFSEMKTLPVWRRRKWASEQERWWHVSARIEEEIERD
jgi:hypothetical protein